MNTPSIIPEPSASAIRAVRANVMGHLHAASDAQRLYHVALTAPDCPRDVVRRRWDEFRATFDRLSAASDPPGSGTPEDVLARAAIWEAAHGFADWARALLTPPPALLAA